MTSQHASDGANVDPSQQTRKVQYDLQVRTLQVSKLKQITPRIRRIQLQGSDLEGFITSSFADHVKIFFPNEDGELTLPTIEQGRIAKPKRGKLSPRRDYTPLNYDPKELTVEFDFALHEGTGIANHWAGAAQVGQELGIVGPRGSKLLPQGFDYYVFGADETAFPAVSRVVTELKPLGKPVFFILQTHSDVEESYFEEAFAEEKLKDKQWDVNYISAPPRGEVDTKMLEKLRDLTLPEGQGYFWFSAEARSLQPLRRYLRQDRGLPKHQVAVDGYWKLGKADHDHHEPVDPKDPS